MRLLTARRLALAAIVPALLVLSVIPGCSNQSEGERCTDDVDCDSALVCKVVPGSPVNRCCYADGNVTDSRCASTGSTSATSSGGAVGTAGGGGAAGVSAGADGGMAGALPNMSTELAGAAGAN